MFTKIKKIYSSVCLKSLELVHAHSSLLMFLIGVGFLNAGMNELAHAQVPTGATGPLIASARATLACGFILSYLEGGFGALLAAGAGIGAVVASALGGFKAAWCLVVVSVGAFILRSYITLFNGVC